MTKHPCYYGTGDAAYKAEDEFVCVMGSADDAISTAGHRLSILGAMEESIMEHPNMAECAVISVKDKIICNAGTTADEDATICSELVQLVRDGTCREFQESGNWRQQITKDEIRKYFERDHD